VAILEDLLSEVPSGVERSDVLFALAPTLRGGPPAMIAACDEALVEAAADDARAARILAFRSWLQTIELDIPAAMTDGRAALERAERAGDPTLLAVAIGELGNAEIQAAEITPGLLRRGAEIEERLDVSLEYHNSPRVSLARLLLREGDLDESRTIFEEIAAKAGARGDEGTYGQVVWELSFVEWLAGRWSPALEHATAAYELAAQTQGPVYRAIAGRNKALVEADLGLSESARTTADEVHAISQAIPMEVLSIISLFVRGHLELTLGNLEAAGSCLSELPSRLLARGWNNPVLPVWADSIEVSIALGELDRARAHLDPYELHGRRIDSPWAVASAARCRGVLMAATGDLEAAFAAFEGALTTLEPFPFPFEHARALLCLGSAHRQARRKHAARDALEQALAIFEELGARPWMEKAGAELRRVSGRRPSETLTETEERVARLASQGHSNKEIASALFMSVHTVEAHLTRVYRKLELRSRGQLAARLTEK
jgi:DNA-binding CsgD family transcriptional regulator